ncbi:MAG: CapA family protein [Synechococcales cyanobacterium K44_A2020_017]|nr:CapA family protein [Synechococcales cyanobacterium K32_A2020_035]MBF2093404.1 CapA family protein [Synechococcales cyanobacterium K44_A2020_017]
MLSMEQVNLGAVVQSARRGDLTAIAYWLNLYLLPQGCCAKVTQLLPTRMHVVVLCRQLPDRQIMLTAMSDRLLRLGLPTLCWAHITVKLASSTDVILWEETLTLGVPPAPVPVPQPIAQPSGLQVWLRNVGQTCASAVDTIMGSKPSNTVALYRPVEPRWSPRKVWLGGSAALAFLLGCGVEAVSHVTTLNAADPSQVGTLPLPDFLGRSPVPTSGMVQAALEPVPVVIHPISHSRPTLTLSFSGAPWLSTATTMVNPIQNADVALSYLDIPDVVDEQTADWPTEDAWIDSGIDVVSTPSQVDELRSRRADVQRILSVLEQAGLRTVGHGTTPTAARRPEILDVNGKRIAYLSYTSSVASTSDPLTDQITTDVQAIRPQVDWVIVNFHWQDAMADYPSAQQVNLAHHAVDQGSDLVIGYHPQVLQGAEIYRGRAIAYSIGNFMPEGDAADPATANYDTAVLKVSLRDEQMRLEVLPVQVEAGQPRLADQDKAEQIQTYLDQASGLFDEPLQSPIVLDRRIEQSDFDVQDKPASGFRHESDIQDESGFQDDSQPKDTSGEARVRDGENMQDPELLDNSFTTFPTADPWDTPLDELRSDEPSVEDEP